MKGTTCTGILTKPFHMCRRARYTLESTIAGIEGNRAGFLVPCKHGCLELRKLSGAPVSCFSTVQSVQCLLVQRSPKPTGQALLENISFCVPSMYNTTLCIL